MVSGWRSHTIGSLCDTGVAALQTGPFGSQLHASDYVDDGIPVVPTEAIHNRRIDHSVLPRVSPAKAQELERHRLVRGDILFARRGVQATGHIGFVREAEDGFLCGTGAIRLRIKSDDGYVNPNFLSHVLANPASVEWFKFHAIGATMPNLNEGIIRSFPLEIPPPAEQLAIAHILGTLDDKIELDRRMNETLEAMAKALFKSWFVDFDPVCAKAEGRDPGLPEDVAELFPSHLVDSELGEIPAGWEVGRLGEVADRVLEKVQDQTDWQDEPLIDLGRMPQRSIALHDWGLGAELTTSVTRFKVKDTLFGAIRPYFHKVGTAPVDGVTNVSVFVVRARRETDGPFVLMLASTDDVVDYATRVAKGTKMPVVSWPDFASYPLCVPPSEVRMAFGQVATPIVDRILGSVIETQLLAALRDTLLPELVSGELRVGAVGASIKEMTH